MVYIFLGPPTSGKGTQAELLRKYLKIPHVSTGELLRKEIQKNSSEGIILAKYVNQGEWPPDELVVKILKKRLMNKDCSKGFILDGVPRTTGQIPMLDSLLLSLHQKIEKVIHFDLPLSEVLKRVITQKRDDPSRQDTSTETTKKRYKSYVDTVAPIVSEYRKRKILLEVNANETIDNIFNTILSKLKIKK